MLPELFGVKIQFFRDFCSITKYLVAERATQRRQGDDRCLRIPQKASATAAIESLNSSVVVRDDSISSNICLHLLLALSQSQVNVTFRTSSRR
jgi:hypothetical protein